MFTFFSNHKKIFVVFLTVVLFAAALSGCSKKDNEKPQPNPTEEKRICSFSISNLDSAFSLEKVSFTVRYGINSASINLENYKAGFIISKNDGSKAILQSIENLENDDYSFTASDGDYSYKKETVLSLENSFFDEPDGEFFLGLFLFSKTDNTLENPIAGYQYKVAYKISDGKIAFEIKNGAVVRLH